MPNGEHQTPGGWNRVVLKVVDLPACIAELKRPGLPFATRWRLVLVVARSKSDPDGNPLELFEPASRS